MSTTEEYNLLKTIVTHMWIRDETLYVIWDTYCIYTGPNPTTILHCSREKCGIRSFTSGEIFEKAEQILKLNKTANKTLEWPFKRSIVTKEQMLEFLDAIDQKNRDRREL